jgi:hypothetical protein
MMTIQAFLPRRKQTAERKTWTEVFVQYFSPFESLSTGRGNTFFPASCHLGRDISHPEGAM